MAVDSQLAATSDDDPRSWRREWTDESLRFPHEAAWKSPARRRPSDRQIWARDLNLRNTVGIMHPMLGVLKHQSLVAWREDCARMVCVSDRPPQLYFPAVFELQQGVPQDFSRIIEARRLERAVDDDVLGLH